MYYTSKYVLKQFIIYKVVKTCIFYLHPSCFVFKLVDEVLFFKSKSAEI